MSEHKNPQNSLLCTCVTLGVYIQMIKEEEEEDETVEKEGMARK